MRFVLDASVAGFAGALGAGIVEMVARRCMGVVEERVYRRIVQEIAEGAQDLKSGRGRADGG